MCENMGGSKTARARRTRRVLELTITGMTIPDISKTMIAEGFAASERTVWDHQQNAEAQAFLKELLRRQLGDITIAPREERLKYRDKLLGKLIPTRIEQRINHDGEVEVTIPDLEGLDEDAVGAIIQNFMDNEARRLRQEQPSPLLSSEELPEKGVDPKG